MKKLCVAIVMDDYEKREHAKVREAYTDNELRLLVVEMEDGDKHYYNIDLIRKFSYLIWEDEE